MTKKKKASSFSMVTYGTSADSSSGTSYSGYGGTLTLGDDIIWTSGDTFILDGTLEPWEFTFKTPELKCSVCGKNICKGDKYISMSILEKNTDMFLFYSPMVKDTEHYYVHLKCFIHKLEGLKDLITLDAIIGGVSVTE